MSVQGLVRAVRGPVERMPRSKYNKNPRAGRSGPGEGGAMRRISGHARRRVCDPACGIKGSRPYRLGPYSLADVHVPLAPVPIVIDGYLLGILVVMVLPIPVVAIVGNLLAVAVIVAVSGVLLHHDH